jgi:hypothetical protein
MTIQIPKTLLLDAFQILSSHLYLSIPTGYIITDFPIKITYAFLGSPIHAPYPAHHNLLDVTILQYNVSSINCKVPHCTIFSIRDLRFSQQ